MLPVYGDTIIFPQPVNGPDYIVNPVNSPGTGRYFAWPHGMVIDANTGAIDVMKSETGMKYAIGFIKEGTTDTCLGSLVIGGAAYFDSVYVLGNGQNALHLISKPILIFLPSARAMAVLSTSRAPQQS